MFSGIIEAMGRVAKIKSRENNLIFSIEHQFPLKELKIGDSVACDGTCLTVISFDEALFTVECSPETISRTIAGHYQVGSGINLERAIRFGDKIGGHFVTGHIDHTGKVTKIERTGRSLEVTINFDQCFDRLVVEKGSIAINGVSLTINQTGTGWCTVNLIPHTIEQTNLKSLNVNDKVNLEFDLIGKYSLKQTLKSEQSNLTIAKLQESGW